jgi:hypothetical protein
MRKRQIRADGFFAWTCQLVGVGVLAGGMILSVPVALAATSAPAGAVVTPPYQPQQLQPSVPCGNIDADVCAQIVVNKTDSWTGAPLAGAGLTLFVAAFHNGTWSCGTTAIRSEVKTDASGNAVFVVPVVRQLSDPVVLCVTETTVPPGYSASTTPNTVFVAVSDEFRVDGTDTCLLPQIVGARPQQTSDSTENVCVSPASLTNDPDPVTINIQKIGTAGAGLNGAGFTLEGGSPLAPVSTGTGGVVNGSNSCVTSGGTATVSATCSISNIMIAGDYTLVETATPSDYQTAAPVPVTVTLGVGPILVSVSDAAVVVPTAPSGNTTPPTVAAVAGATAVHTGQPFAGSVPLVGASLVGGCSLVGLGWIKRRSARARHLRV